MEHEFGSFPAPAASDRRAKPNEDAVKVVEAGANAVRESSVMAIFRRNLTPDLSVSQ